MNRGVRTGLVSDGWKPFNPAVPILAGFSAGSGPTQPLLGSAAVVAHYLHEEQQGNVKYQGYIQFASDTTFGSNDQVWGIRLPVPALRVLGGADMPVGRGWAWQGSAGNRNVGLTATLMDPLSFGGGNQSNEDYYIQFFTPYILATGTSAQTSGTTTITVTHGLGMTPVNFDINVVATNTASTTPGEIYVDNVTSTTFDWHVRASATTTPQTMAWKIRAEPNGTTTLDLLVNSARPLGAWASGWLLGWNVEYQARR